jgi:polysaccharide export outer membrane protein
MISRRGLVCFAMLALAGCAAPGANLPPLEQTAAGRYRLDSGDQLRVSVFSLPDLPPNYAINDSGWISMPLVGAVEARGLTTDELEDRIEKELAKGLVRNPSVSVQVERFRPFYILGEVKQPGQYPYIPGITVLSAVSIAGGYTFRAETDYVSITRPKGEGAIEGRAPRQALVLPGDTIYVFERWF